MLTQAINLLASARPNLGAAGQGWRTPAAGGGAPLPSLGWTTVRCPYQQNEATMLMRGRRRQPSVWPSGKPRGGGGASEASEAGQGRCTPAVAENPVRQTTGGAAEGGGRGGWRRRQRRGTRRRRWRRIGDEKVAKCWRGRVAAFIYRHTSSLRSCNEPWQKERLSSRLVIPPGTKGWFRAGVSKGKISLFSTRWFYDPRQKGGLLSRVVKPPGTKGLFWVGL
jgi:hypothetical protein